MNATKRSMARAGLVAGSVLAVALTGCRTHVVHERTRTVYVAPPPVAYVPPATAPPVVNVTAVGQKLLRPLRERRGARVRIRASKWRARLLDEHHELANRLARLRREHRLHVRVPHGAED